MDINSVLWRIEVRIGYLEESLYNAESVEEVNNINYAIEELEELKKDFLEKSIK